MTKSNGKHGLSFVLVFVLVAGLIMSGAMASDLALAGKAYHKIGPIHLSHRFAPPLSWVVRPRYHGR